jgi:hypothetical protein
VTDETPTPEAGQVPDDAPKRNKEARYRVERNDARAERDALARRVELLQRKELERVAGAHLASPADLLTLSGNALADYLNESGDIDPDKVRADAQVILAERPGLRPNAPAIDPTQGTGGGTKAAEPTWSALLS